jgi:hypothetical protein
MVPHYGINRELTLLKKILPHRLPLSDKTMMIHKTSINLFDGNFLFPQNDKDGSAPTRALDSFHRKVFNKPGAKFRLYDCRYKFATRTLENGTDLLMIFPLLDERILKWFPGSHIPGRMKGRSDSPDTKPMGKHSRCEKCTQWLHFKTHPSFSKLELSL